MLVLHIGPHKTGTTYLQTNFKQQRAELAKRGWLYPVIGVRTALAHHEIVEHAGQVAAGVGRVVNDLRAVAREAEAKGLDVLLSAEGFRRWEPEQVAALADFFGRPQVRIVYVLRDPMSVLRSMWSQSVKLGETMELPRFVASHARDAKRSRLLNPLRDISPYLRQEGMDLTILLYDELERRKIDLFSTFAREALSIDDLGPSALAANVRQPVELTEFLRLLSLDGYKSLPGRLDVGDAVRFLFSPEQREEIVETIRERGAAARRTFPVLRATEEYETLETKLRDRAGGYFRPRLESGRLFPADGERWTYYSADALMRIPEIAKLTKRAARAIGPTGLRMAILNGGLKAMMAGRRLANLVVAKSG